MKCMLPKLRCGCASVAIALSLSYVATGVQLKVALKSSHRSDSSQSDYDDGRTNGKASVVGRALRADTQLEDKDFFDDGCDSDYDEDDRGSVGQGKVKTSCPLVQKKESDYKHVKTLLKVLKMLKRPYFVGGGSGLCLLRFGALSVQLNASTRVACDGDLDIFMYSKDDDDRQALRYDLLTACQSFSHQFSQCTDYFRIGWRPKGGTSLCTAQEGRCKNCNCMDPAGAEADSPADPFADVYDLRDFNSSHMYVKAWGVHNRSWFMRREILLPSSTAQYYDQSVPMARDVMSYYAASMSWDDTPGPEYGMGCNNLAYPGFLMQQLSNSQGHCAMRRCAFSLQKAGKASFAQCFDTES